MAKNNNLKDFLTDVADAIREKKGTTEKINPQDFSSEIKGIEGEDTLSDVVIDNTGLGTKNIKKIIIAEGVTSIGSSAYDTCNRMTSVVIPDSVTVINPQAFRGCGSLISAVVPEGVTRYNDYIFMNCSKLESVNIHQGVVYIGTGAFQNCQSFKVAVTIPKAVQTIKNATFNQCVKIPYFDFSSHEAVPTLENINAFSNITGKIVVPDNLYDEWIVATNWSTYASRIVKASEFVEPTNE